MLTMRIFISISTAPFLYRQKSLYSVQVPIPPSMPMLKIQFASLTSDSTLREWNLDVNRLTIDFTEETFLDYNDLEISNFNLINAPVGLNIEAVTGVSPTRVRIDLVYTGLDFDVTIEDFALDIVDTVLPADNLRIPPNG